MSAKVLVTDYAWPDLDLEVAILRDVGAEIVLPESTDESSLVSAVGDAQAIMTNWARVTDRVIDSCPSLRIVARLGVGLDNIDVAHATRLGIPVTNVPGYCDVEVAEHTIALLFALARNVAIHHRATKNGVYDISLGPTMRRMAGRTLGLVGLGGIGREVARRAHALGLEVLAATRSSTEPVAGVTRVALAELLVRSDFVSVHAPLTNETKPLIGAAELGRMKRGAFLINTARGALVDHEALARALDSGHLSGAGLDVQDPEPPGLDRPPFDDENVIVTPHTAFVSEQSLRELRTRAATQVAARLSGHVPENVVNPDVL